MENTQHTPQLDAEVAQLLQSNPTAAHFVADLASGTALKEAVANHFGEYFAPSAEAPAQSADDTPPTATDTSAPLAPMPQPPTIPDGQAPMYAPVGIAPTDQAAPDADVDDSPDDPFLVVRPSVWD